MVHESILEAAMNAYVSLPYNKQSPCKQVVRLVLHLYLYSNVYVCDKL